MLTIITRKRWRKLMDDQQRMRETLARYDEVMRNLVRRLSRMEKDFDKMKKENRDLKAELKKLKDNA